MPALFHTASIKHGSTALPSHIARYSSNFTCQSIYATQNQAIHQEKLQQATILEAYHLHQSHSFDTIWLRENCRCDSCYNHATNQRNELFHEFSDTHIDVVQHTSEDGALRVRWADGHVSEYPWQWLLRNKHPGDTSPVEKILWDGNDICGVSLDFVPFSDVINGDDGLRRLLHSLLVYGVGLIENAPTTLEATQEAAEKVSFIQHTLFGKMWQFTADLARGDTAYTNIALGAHTDTTYLSQPAGIQVFHCLSHDGEGGETLLLDGFHAAEQLRRVDKEAFSLLCEHRINHEYIEAGHHVVSLDPVLKVHPVTGELEMIRYNHYDRSPISTIPQEALGKYYAALKSLSSIINKKEQEFFLKLRPGNILFVDNWRVLHGRSAYTGNRSVCGCYLPRDDWIGKARIIGLL